MTINEARKEVKRLHNIMKVNGWKSEKGMEAGTAETNLYKEFLTEHGESALFELRCGKPSNFGKSKKSKGYEDF